MSSNDITFSLPVVQYRKKSLIMYHSHQPTVKLYDWEHDHQQETMVFQCFDLKRLAEVFKFILYYYNFFVTVLHTE